MVCVRGYHHLSAADTLVQQSVDVVNALDCRKEAFVQGLNEEPVVAATCRLESRYALGKVFAEIHMGTSPEALRPITPEAYIDDYLDRLSRIADTYFAANESGLEQYQLDGQKKRYINQVAGYERRMRTNFLPWHELQKKNNGYVASFAEPPTAAYFQVVFTDGSKSKVIRKGFRG